MEVTWEPVPQIFFVKDKKLFCFGSNSEQELFDDERDFIPDPVDAELPYGVEDLAYYH